MSQRVLVADDSPSMCELLAVDLRERGFDVVTCTSGDEAQRLVFSDDFDAVVTDIFMGDFNGIEFCARVAQERPDLPVVVMTAFGSFEVAVEALRAGAYDFISKPFDSEVLAATLRRAVQHQALRKEVRRLRRAVAEAEGFGGLLGESRPMKQLYKVLAKVAKSPSTTLIFGETGTGKELVARGLHEQSARSQGPFVAFNCAAMPQQLAESVLFGHVRGAFTDARGAHEGLFVQADGGTIFLDEIGELSLALQPKLLRTLQERTVRPIGATKDVAVDVRVVAATNRDLEEEVERGRFREDLLFRINVIRVDLPPLRCRGNDVLLLAHHFIKDYSRHQGSEVEGLTGRAADKLLAYGWPGNVRELQNSIERAVALAEHNKIFVEDLPEKIRDYKPSQIRLDTDEPTELPTLAEVERRYLARVLEAVGGNKAQAARALGIDRKTLYRKLEKHKL